MEGFMSNHAISQCIITSHDMYQQYTNIYSHNIQQYFSNSSLGCDIKVQPTLLVLPAPLKDAHSLDPRCNPLDLLIVGISGHHRMIYTHGQQLHQTLND